MILLNKSEPVLSLLKDLLLFLDLLNFKTLTQY
jgi:hypothetical protein